MRGTARVQPSSRGLLGRGLVPVLLVATALSGCATWAAALPRATSFPRGDAADPPLSVDAMAAYLEARLELRRRAVDGEALSRAEAAIRRALGVRPEDPQLWQALAEVHAAASDYNAALVAAEEGHQRAADDPAIAWTAGEQLFRLERWMEAEKHFEIATRGGIAGTEASLPWFYLYLSRRNLGKIDGALEALRSWSERIPGDAGPRPLRATLLWQEGRIDEAREEALAALRAHPDAGAEECLRIVEESEPMRPHRAAERLEEVARVHPTSITLRGALSRLWSEAARPDRALPHARIVAVLRDDDATGALLDLAAVQRALFLDAEARDTVARARALVPEGEVEDVVQVAEAELEAAAGRWVRAAELLAAAGPGPELQARVVQLHVDAGEDERALAAAEVLRAQLRAAPQPGAALALLSAARSATRLGLASPIRGYAESLRSPHPERASLLDARVLAVEGRITDAAAKVRALGPSLDVARLGERCEALAEWGDLPGARDLVARSLQELMQTLDRTRRLGEGVGAFQFHAESERRRVPIELLAADLAYRAGDLLAAESVLEALLARHPEDGVALNFLGFVLADSGRDLPRARDLLTRAMALRPVDPAVRDSLGWLLFREGRIDEAIEQLRLAAEQSRFDPEILDHLGDAYAAAGDRARARTAWERVRDEADPHDSRQRRVLERVDGKLP